MYRIDNSTAVPNGSGIPTPAAVGPNVNGYFTNGNPLSATPATIVDNDWANSVQEEICNVITAAGITLSKTAYNQLLTAILDLMTANGSWQNETSSRVAGTVYTNSTGKPLLVCVTFPYVSSAYVLAFFVAGMEIISTVVSGGNQNSLTCLVPIGATYEVTGPVASSSSDSWMELH